MMLLFSYFVYFFSNLSNFLHIHCTFIILMYIYYYEEITFKFEKFFSPWLCNSSSCGYTLVYLIFTQIVDIKCPFQGQQ